MSEKIGMLIVVVIWLLEKRSPVTVPMPAARSKRKPRPLGASPLKKRYVPSRRPRPTVPRTRIPGVHATGAKVFAARSSLRPQRNRPSLIAALKTEDRGAGEGGGLTKC
ncbi:MAG: hypothetical protein R3A52_14355 [Polyangiales bacterium]